MKFTPVVHDHEEELIDPRDFLPPSFFTDSNNLNKSNNSFVEPPSDSASPSSSPIPSPLPLPLPLPHRTEPLNNSTSLNHASASHRVFTSSPSSLSPSPHHSSSPKEPTLSDDDRRSSPVAIANYPDRPRPHQSNRRPTSDKVSSKSGFTRVTPPVSPEHVSATSPESVMHYPPNTSRLMRIVTNGHFRVLGAKASLNKREQKIGPQKMR